MNVMTLPFASSISEHANLWRLEDDVLIEDGQECSRIYGRWDREFGCWLQSKDNITPFIPDWPIIGHHGCWLEPAGKRDNAWYESRAAIAAYFSLIPTPIRRLVAPYGNRQWELLEAIWHDSRQASFLDADQSNHVA
jgi:hypothetical protein